MKFGLWFLSAAGVVAVGTLLAASLPVPPSLPSVAPRQSRTVPLQVAAAPAPSTPAEPTTPPAPPPQAAAAQPKAAAIPPAAPAPAIERPKRVAAAATGTRSADPSRTAKRPTRHVTKAAPDRHPRAVAHATAPRYGAVVPKPPPALYPGTSLRERTHVAMMPPPPYGMPPPYWRMPYPPEY